MDNQASVKPGYLGLVGGVIFIGLGILDFFEGSIILGIGFLTIGIAVMIRTQLFHSLFGLDSRDPGTPLWIASYGLSIVAGIAFVAEVITRLTG